LSDPFCSLISSFQDARSDSKHLSRLLAQGAKLECRVIEADPEAGAWNLVRVEVGIV
jgi:hypothetical protein